MLMSTKKLNLLVIAHYDPEGILRFDTLSAILIAKDFFDKIYLVSTNLSDAEACKIPTSISCRRRANYGYDFYSYREGILEASTEFDFQNELASLTLMNSSFLITDPITFFQRLSLNLNHPGRVVSGATKSFDHGEHLQSFLLTFNAEALSNKKFMDWWYNMVPINDKQSVILSYEIGLSVFLKNLGFSLNAPIVGNSRRNPSHEYYAELLDLFGIIKFELIKLNPARINLHYFITKVSKDKNLRKRLFKSLGYQGNFYKAKLKFKFLILRKLGKFLSKQRV